MGTMQVLRQRIKKIFGSLINTNMSDISWPEFVKRFAASNNYTYAQAMVYAKQPWADYKNELQEIKRREASENAEKSSKPKTKKQADASYFRTRSRPSSPNEENISDSDNSKRSRRSSKKVSKASKSSKSGKKVIYYSSSSDDSSDEEEIVYHRISKPKKKTAPKVRYVYASDSEDSSD